VTLTHGKLPKIISAETRESFLHFRENLPALKNAFYAAELVLKFTADQQPNQQLFESLVEFLKFLDSSPPEAILPAGLLKFKLDCLSASGLSVNYPGDYQSQQLYFSPSQGGFSSRQSADSVPVGPWALEILPNLLRSPAYSPLPNIPEHQVAELQN